MSRHLVIDVRMAANSGIGTYIRNVVPRVIAARPEWRFTLLTDGGWPGDATGMGDARVQLRPCRSAIYSVAEQVEMVAHTPRDADLFWSPHLNVPLLFRGRLAVTVHDVAHLALPDVIRSRIKRGYARLMFEAIRRKASALICDSDFTRREFARLVGARSPQPHVIHLGVGDEWRASARADGESAARQAPYLVAVGNVKPHKNLGALVRAFAAIRERIPHELVLIGRNEGMRTVDDAVMRAVSVPGSRIRFTGEVAEDTLRQLVAAADLLVMPSRYEGFGLPPLEAMAAGCPTLVSTAGSLPEVCGDTSLYCDPYDEVQMAAQLERVLTDASLRQELRARGRAHVARFTWERCTMETVAVLDATMRKTHSAPAERLG